MSKMLHRIKAYLYENPLTDTPDDYMARVSSERSLDIPAICNSAVTRGRADISAEAMRHGVELFLKEMAYHLCDGFSVNTGYFTATPLIKGVFNSPDETFNAEKHTILFQFHQGEALRKELSTIEVQVLGVAGSSHYITKATDVKSGLVNDKLTPGYNLKIAGSKIKLVGDDASIGVYFRNMDTNTCIKIDASDIVVNKPSELIVMIPPLPPGEYQLEVITQYAVSSILKTPRSIVFDRMLAVML